MAIESFTRKEGGIYVHTFLSNFYVEPDGTTVEHEFQAAKTDDLREKVSILSAPTPGEAKKRGQQITLKEDWDEQRLAEMRNFVFRKFWDHPELAQQLLDTGDEELIEGNTWGDTFWGVYRGRGENWLGKILMEVRRVIQWSEHA